MGSTKTAPLARAREEAKRLRASVNDGKNPLAERRKAELETASRKTFEQAARFVIDRDKGGWDLNWIKSWERSLFEHSKRLTPLGVDEISVEHLKQAIAPLWDRGDHVSARRTLSRIETVLACALAHGWRREANVAAWSVFKHVSPKRPKSDDDRHHPTVPWRQAPEMIDRLRTIDTFAARALELAALTGVRISEATDATWTEFDFDKGLRFIPKSRMKMGEPHTVPLSKQAIELLNGLRAHRIGPLMFPRRFDGAPVTRMQCWRVIKEITEGAGSPQESVDSVMVRRARHRSRGCGIDFGAQGLGRRRQLNANSMVERRRPIMQARSDFLDGATVVPFKSKSR